MLQSTLEARIYFFACNMLWDVLSLFHYLDEDVAKQSIGSLYLKWSTQFADLANWALEERFFPIEDEKVERNEKDLLFSKADTLGDLLTFHLARELNEATIKTHKEHPRIIESMWMYYYYCGFLRQVLTEFDRVLQEPGSSPTYYEHYRQDINLFNDMAKALENERPFLDSTKAGINEAFIQAVWDDIATCALKLGAEWRQAVHSPARNLELPDLGENRVGPQSF